jgi:hypothetical protein
MIEPFPNCRSIWEMAASIALLLSNGPPTGGRVAINRYRLKSEYTGAPIGFNESKDTE